MKTQSLVPSTRGALKGALAFALIAFSVSATQAATLTFVGAQFNDTAWRTASDVKPYSTAGSNIYGKDGYRFFSSPITTVLPSYVSSMTVLTAQYGPYGTAGAQIDNPVSSGTTVGTGTTYVNGAAAGLTSEMFSFTLTGTVPATVRISILYDNTDGTQPNVRLSLATNGGGATVPGGSASVVVSNTNQIADWYTFDIAGAVAGQSYSIYLTNTDTVNRGLQVGGIAFDSITAVPEPASFALLAGASIMGITIAGRRRRT